MKRLIDNKVELIVALMVILLFVTIIYGIVLGNPFASHFNAVVLVKDKEMSSLNYVTVEFTYDDPENSVKKGDRKLFAVNGDDNFAQLVVGETADVSIRGGHIINAYHNKPGE
jgi:hypothetical protein